MTNSVELELDYQINYVTSMLQYDEESKQSMNPFITGSNRAMLESIRKSLLELKSLKDKNS